MTTKSSEISSGLVAVRIDTDGYPLVRLSDAEAIIAQKDAEILEQCRINGMGAERELALLGQIKRQLVKAEENEAIIAAANALENIASTSSSTRIRRVANDALKAIRARRK